MLFAKPARVAAAILLLSAAACEPAALPSSADPTRTPVAPIRGTPLQTRIGSLYVDIPPGYVALSKADPLSFQTQKAVVQGPLEVVEVFVTRRDLERMRARQIPLLDQMVQIHLFPGDAHIPDAQWPQFRHEWPRLIGGDRVTREIASSRQRVQERLDSIPGNMDVQSMRSDQVVVYGESDRDVRFMVRAAIDGDDAGTPIHYQALMTSALKRLGDVPYMVQGVMVLSEPEEATAARESFDRWVDAVQ